MKSDVFNNTLGSPYLFSYPTLTIAEENTIIAKLFEQLLIFDQITICVSRQNFALAFLIKHLGINTVERLIDSGYIKFLLWTPIIVTSTGMKDDKTMDESSIYGQPPVITGELSAEDLDPERGIKYALSHFNLHKDRVKIFTKKALKNFEVPEGMEFSTDAAELVVDAYVNNNLADLNLPFTKDANQLDLKERGILLDLSNKVLETAILSQYGLKSFENYESFKICETNINNIGKAYNIAENSAQLFRINNTPDLKELYLTGKLHFDTVFKIRHLSNAKYYRKWINEVGETSNAQEVTSEYLKEIKGAHKFFEKPGGKLVKNLTSFGIQTGVGAAIPGPVGAAAGFVLGLLETFWIDSILEGKNPSMFIDDVKEEINNQEPEV